MAEEIKTNEIETEETQTQSNDDIIAELRLAVAKLTADNDKLKKSNDKLSSENAKKSKQIRDNMTQDELKEQERAELEQKYENMKREMKIAECKSNYLALGYDEELASQSAIAYCDGDFESLVKLQKKADEMKEKKIKSDMMKGMPRSPIGNDGGEELTQEKFNKMGYTARVELLARNPKLYEKFSRGK